LSLLYDIFLDVLPDGSLTENPFTTLVLSKNQINRSTDIHLLSMIRTPSDADLINLGIVGTSTSLILIILHVTGVILLLFVLTLLISFFIINVK